MGGICNVNVILILIPSPFQQLSTPNEDLKQHQQRPTTMTLIPPADHLSTSMVNYNPSPSP